MKQGVLEGSSDSRRFLQLVAIVAVQGTACGGRLGGDEGSDAGMMSMSTNPSNGALDSGASRVGSSSDLPLDGASGSGSGHDAGCVVRYGGVRREELSTMSECGDGPGSSTFKGCLVDSDCRAIRTRPDCFAPVLTAYGVSIVKAAAFTQCFPPPSCPQSVDTVSEDGHSSREIRFEVKCVLDAACNGLCRTLVP